jgi:hypothetical protein
VIACDPSGPAGVRTDGAQSLVRVAALTDLPRVLRGVAA